MLPLTTLAALLLAVTVVHGEPYIALREGLRCATCHVNHTGGGMRNGYGALFSQTEILPLLEEMSEEALDFSADLGPSLTLGSDFILANELVQSVDDQDSQNTFRVDSGNLYLHARLIPGRLSLYVDETVAPGSASNREAFVLLEGIGDSGYLKAGRLLLPYGIRMWDDAAFVRQATGFNYDNQDLGLEVGLEPGPFSVAVALSNGSQGAADDNKAKQVSVVGSYWSRLVVVGASAAYNDARGIERMVVGPFASLRTGPLTWTGEVDRISDSGGIDNDQVVGFASLDFWYRQAVNVRLAFDYHDPFDGVDEDERSRVSLGFDAFLTPFLSASAYYRSADSVPQDMAGNADRLTVSLHSFF
jgi:hypothetical protein